MGSTQGDGPQPRWWVGWGGGAVHKIPLRRMEVLRSESPPRGYDLEDPSSVMDTAYAMEPMDEESTIAATLIAAELDEGGAAQINQQDAYATTQSSNVSEPTSHLKYAEACRAEEEMPNHVVEQDLVSLRQDVQKIALAEKKQERAKTVLKHAHFLSSVMREFQLIFDQVSICVAIAVKQLRSGNAEAQSNDYNHITRHVCCVLFVLGRLATLIGMSLCNAALAGGRNLCFLLERRLIHYGFDAISSAEELCPSTSAHSQWLIARGDLELHSVPFARDLSSNTCMYSGTWDSTAVMIKSVRRESAETRRAFLNELEIWSKLQHPHVVRLLGACDDDQSLFVCEMAKKHFRHMFTAKTKEKCGQNCMKLRSVYYIYTRSMAWCMVISSVLIFLSVTTTRQNSLTLCLQSAVYLWQVTMALSVGIPLQRLHTKWTIHRLLQMCTLLVCVLSRPQ